MAIVHLPGEQSVTIDAPRVPELFAALRQRFPDIADQLEEMAIAIDGDIYQDPGYQDLRPETEVHFVPRIAGG
ncbi:MAG TPA: MoaD/ThiS family protein [Vicinamibacterales bacterium]|nr:MoaD/ThiS family protein [Vicinamibacterales bacterium]